MPNWPPSEQDMDILMRALLSFVYQHGGEAVVTFEELNDPKIINVVEEDDKIMIYVKRKGTRNN